MSLWIPCVAYCSPGYKICTFHLCKSPKNGLWRPPSFSVRRQSTYRLAMDGLSFGILIQLLPLLNFRRSFLHKLSVSLRKHGICESDLLIVIRLRNPHCFPIDLNWNHKMEVVLQRYLEAEKLMWWLSTLGGGFSALGDHHTDFAEKAGEISKGQLGIAVWLGDPVLISRCKLYLALSYMQRGRLKLARTIIKKEHSFAKFADHTILVNCCIGVWEKLRYYYYIRKTSRVHPMLCT